MTSISCDFDLRLIGSPNQDPQTIGLEIQVEFGWNLRILVSLNTEYPWSYPCIGWYTFWYTFWISIQQGQILEELDPPSTGISCRNHWQRRKIINQCGNGSQPAEIGQKIRFCGTRYFNPESWVFLKNPTSINGSPEAIFGRSESQEDSILASGTFCRYCGCF